MSKDINFACRIHSTVQNDIGKQQWVTGFHCILRGWLIVYKDGDYLYPGQYSQTRSDDTVFGAGAFSWQDPVHSWKAGPVENKQTKAKH